MQSGELNLSITLLHYAIPLFELCDNSLSLFLLVQLRAYEDDAVIAGYVLCQEGKKWTKMWYQVKKDCVLYKFKAHEVRRGMGLGSLVWPA